MFPFPDVNLGRSRWLRGLRCGSAATRFLGLQVRISPESWMSVFCECCVLSAVSASGRSFVLRSPAMYVRVTRCDQVHR